MFIIEKELNTIQTITSILESALMSFSLALIIQSSHYSLFNNMFICYSARKSLKSQNTHLESMSQSKISSKSVWTLKLTQFLDHHQRVVRFMMYYNQNYSVMVYGFLISSVFYNAYMVCLVLYGRLQSNGVVLSVCVLSIQIYAAIGCIVPLISVNSALHSANSCLHRIQSRVKGMPVIFKIKLANYGELICGSNKFMGMTIGVFGKANTKSLLEVGLKDLMSIAKR